MISLTLFLVIGLITATDDSSRLRKTNTALRSALKSLTAEKGVGEERVGSAKSTCGEMTAYKKCSGRQHEVGNWGRETQSSPLSAATDGLTGWNLCQLKCENMGIPGCCEYQRDNEKCYFTAFGSSTESDSGYEDKWSREKREMFRYPSRYGSVCSVPNCVYEMQPLPWRVMECDWNGLDKAGRGGSGGGHSLNACMNSCLQDPNCVFVSRSSTGYCHRFATCNHQPGGDGWITQEKVCKGTIEYSNVPWCTGNNCI